MHIDCKFYRLLTSDSIKGILSMMKIILGVIAFLLTTLVAMGAYLIYQNQFSTSKSPNNPPSPQITSSPKSTTPSPENSPSPFITLEITQNAIKTNVNGNNYQGLINYAADQVNVILQATECCGMQTPQEAVNQVSSYSEAGISFDFDQTNPTIVNLKDKNPELAGKFVGIAASEQLIAFGINEKNLIDELRMSVSWKLFNF